jgi:uncharacterized protein with NRDE domain
MNRDEAHTRPASPPQWSHTKPRILAPRDRTAGGTWIGTNEFGLVAALSNRPGEVDTSRRSRGLLCLETLACPDGQTALQFASKEVQRRAYNNLNLMIADRRRAEVLFHENGKTWRKGLMEGINVLTNLNANDGREWKVRRVHARLRGRALDDVDEAASALRDALTSHETSSRGRATCNHASEWGTVSLTVIAVPEGGRGPVVFYADGPPCEVPLRRIG